MVDGETFVGVALRFGADIDELHINPDDLYVPKKASLRVPPTAGGLLALPNDLDQHDEIPFAIKTTDIVIDDTDTLEGLAERWAVSIRELTLYNASVVRVRRGAFVTIIANSKKKNI